MTTFINSDGDLVYGANAQELITASDMSNLKDFYAVTGGFPIPNSTTVYIDHFLNVINYIDNFLATNPYTLDYDIWNALKARLNSNSRGTTIYHDYVWPRLIRLNPHSFLFDNSVTFTVPLGTTNITIDYLIGAGGAGATGTNHRYGHYCAGGGGAGGYYQNVQLACSPGDVFSFSMGARGIAPDRDNPSITMNGTDGGPSVISLNGVAKFTATGGKAANQTNGGAGGSPNGQGGQGGWWPKHKKECGGTCGGANILGNRACSERADGYRGCGGGGGAGISDHQGDYVSPGGYGGNGFAQITMLCIDGWSP